MRILGARDDLEHVASRTMSATETPSHLRENPLDLARAQLSRVGEAFGAGWGKQGLQLMSKIHKVDDLGTLKAIRKAIETAGTLDKIQALLS